MKRILYVFLLILSVVFVGGCGKQNIMDIYSFGSQSFTVANSAISVELPFGMKPINELPGGNVINNGSANEISYMGGDKHMSVILVGRKIDNEQQTVSQVATNAINRTKLSPNVSNLEFQVDPITIQSVKGEKVHLSYEEHGNKQSVNQYIFYDKNVLWNVIYLYHTGDQVGEDLAKYLDGKISINK